MKTLVVVPCVAVLLSGSLLGQEIVVDLNGGGNFTRIQSAIDAADNGDTVLVMPGEYVESISFGGKAVTVRSQEGAEETTIRALGGNVVVFENSENMEAMKK